MARNNDHRNVNYNHGQDGTRSRLTSFGAATPFGGTALATNDPIVAMRDSGLNFGTRLVPIAIDNPVTGRRETVQDHFSVVRTDTGAVLGKPVGSVFAKSLDAGQNISVFPRLAQPLLATGAGSIVAAGSIDNGSRCWMQLRVNRPDAVIVGGRADDRVGLFVLILTAHDGSLRVHVGPTARRFSCNNMVAGALAARTTMRFRHSKGLDAALQAARDFLAMIGQDFDKVTEVFKALANRTVTEKQIRAMVDVVFPPPKVKETIVQAPALASAASEWDDGPTSPDIASDAPAVTPSDDTGLFSSLMARPVSTLVLKTGLDAELAIASAARAKAETRRIADNIVQIFESGGANGDLNLPGVKGTAWAAYNAVTEYLTHHRGANDENRANTLLFQDPGISGRALTAATDAFLK